MAIIKGKAAIKIVETSGLVRGYNIKDCDASIKVRIATNGDNPLLPIRQFISKSKEKIRYNIYIINITEEEILDIESIDNLPSGAKIQNVTLDGNDKTPVDLYTSSIKFEIPSIEGQRYSKIIIEIDNDPNVEEKTNSMYITKPKS